jgi:hypothetical protein
MDLVVLEDGKKEERVCDDHHHNNAPKTDQVKGVSCM